MLINYRLTGRPATAPIDLTEVKSHLRLFDDDSVPDSYLTALISTSVDMVSTYLGRGIGAHEYAAFYSDFDDLDLPHDSASAVTSVQYYNTANTLVTVASTVYYFDNTSLVPAIRLNTGQSFPTDLHERPAPVVVNYDNDALEEVNSPTIEQALLITIGDLYYAQSSTTTMSVNTLPVAAKHLLRPHKQQRW